MKCFVLIVALSSFLLTRMSVPCPAQTHHWQAQSHRDRAKIQAAKYDWNGAIVQYKAAYAWDKPRNRRDAITDLNGWADAENQAEQYPKALRLSQQALALSHSLKDRVGEAEALCHLTDTANGQGHYKEALRDCQQALTIARRTHDRHTLADALEDLGETCSNLKQYLQALTALQQSLPLCREVGDQKLEADILGNIGLANYFLHRYVQAIPFDQQALLLLRNLKDGRNEAAVLSILAAADDGLKQYDKAFTCYQQALRFYLQFKMRLEEAMTLMNLGNHASVLGKLGQASDFYRQARLVYHQAKRSADEAMALMSLGATDNSLKQYAKAATCYQQALPLFHQIKDRANEGQAYNSLGNANSSLSQYAKALTAYRKALPLFHGAHDQNNTAYAWNNIGDMQIRLGHSSQALAALHQAIILFQSLKNPAGEALAQENTATAYSNLNRYDDALEAYQKAQSSYAALKDLDGEANALNNIGVTNLNSDRYERAITSEQQALTLFQEAKDQKGQADALSNIGKAYNDLSQYDKAIGFDQQALAIYREVKNQNGVASTLIDLSSVSIKLGRYDHVLTFLNQALALYRTVNDIEGQASTFLMMGLAYDALSQHDNALTVNQLALILFQHSKDQDGQARALDNSGADYTFLGQPEKAIQAYQQALPIYRAVKDRSGEAAVLNNIAAVYDSHNQRAKGLVTYYQSLDILREIKNQDGEVYVLTNIGMDEISLGHTDEALDTYQQALIIVRDIHDFDEEAAVLGTLMNAYRTLAQPRLAIFYGKQAINLYQTIRQGLSSLDKSSQTIYLKDKEPTYRALADLLISQGRLPEAQQVLNLLKQQEFFDYTRGGDTHDAGLGGHADLTTDETAQEQNYQKIADQVIALGQQKQTLLDKIKQAGQGGPAISDADKTNLAQINQNLEAANAHFHLFLSQLATVFQAAPQASAQEQMDAIQHASGLQNTLRQLHQNGQDAVVLQTVIAPDRYAVIVTTAQSQKAESYPISAEALNQKIAAFQAVLRSPDMDPRPLAQELYKILFAPVEADIAQSGATTLMWSLDGTLRYIPIAALYDGKQYLAERYSTVIFSLGSQTGFGGDENRTWTGLGLGVSQAHTGFAALPAVPAELYGIIQDPAHSGGVLPGKVLLDGQFTQQSMTDALQEQKYNLVHIASHFALNPGDPNSSYLLLGGGNDTPQRLSLADLANAAQIFQGVDLLTLSACDTATGSSDANGKEVDSLGTIAQQQGASAVIASLWPVSDTSTEMLMRQLYSWHQSHPTTSKAEALRQAQLALLHGPDSTPITGTQRAEIVSDKKNKSLTNTLPFTPDPKAPFSHPYYWAPFILIGNWK